MRPEGAQEISRRTSGAANVFYWPLSRRFTSGYLLIAPPAQGGDYSEYVLKHQSYNGGLCQPPSADSTASAAASATSSRQGRATSCAPMGRPSSEVPARTTTPGQPVML